MSISFASAIEDQKCPGVEKGTHRFSKKEVKKNPNLAAGPPVHPENVGAALGAVLAVIVI
jgi:hypothetical protein